MLFEGKKSLNLTFVIESVFLTEPSMTRSWLRKVRATSGLEMWGAM